MAEVYKVSDAEGNYYIGSRVNNSPTYVGSGKWPMAMVSAGRRSELVERRQVLAAFDCRDEASEFEAFVISECIDDPMCRNIRRSGSGLEYCVSAAGRQRIAKASADRVWTDESKAKISVAHKGKIISKEQRAAQSEAMKGRATANAQAVIVDGIHYRSAHEASKFTGIPRPTISSWCNNQDAFNNRRKFKHLKICVYAQEINHE